VDCADCDDGLVLIDRRITCDNSDGEDFPIMLNLLLNGSAQADAQCFLFGGGGVGAGLGVTQSSLNGAGPVGGEAKKRAWFLDPHND
jgi:hypothetical protein